MCLNQGFFLGDFFNSRTTKMWGNVNWGDVSRDVIVLILIRMGIFGTEWHYDRNICTTLEIFSMKR